MLALKGGLTERIEFLARETPGTAGQTVVAAVAVGDILDRTPIFGPLHFGELLQRAHFAKRDLGLVQLRIECADIGKGQDPVLHDAVQFGEIRPARCRGRKARVVGEVGAPHRPQIGRKGARADEARRHCEVLAAWPCEERAVGRPEDRRLVAEIGIVQIDMRTLVDRHQCRCHRNIDVLTGARRLPPVQCRKDCNRGLQPGIDIGMRQAVGAWFAQYVTVMANAVVGEPGLRLHRRGVSHPARPWPTLAVAGDRGINQARIAGRQRFMVEPEIAQRAGAEVLDNDIRCVAQPQRQFAGAWDVEVDADIALAGVLLRIVARHTRCQRKREARHVGTWRLDLDDLGAEIEESAGAEWTGEHAREIDDADAGKRAAHCQRP